MNRCPFIYVHPIFGDSWQCTKWEGHTKLRRPKWEEIRVHMALAPSDWHPDFAIRLDGMPNNREHYVI